MIRNSTLDNMKGLGIILVALGHNWIVLHEKGELFRIIFSFHMPLFLFVSGVLLRMDVSIRDFVHSRTQSLLKPFAATLVIVTCAATIHRHLGTNDADHASWLRSPSWLFGTGPVMPWNWTPLWFLPHLFLVSTLSFLALRHLKTTSKAGLWALTLLTLIFGISTIDFFWSGFQIAGIVIPAKIGLPWSVDLLLVSIPFYFAGYLLKEEVTGFAFKAHRLFIAGLLFAVLHYSLDDTIDLNLRVYGRMLVATVQAFAGIYICLCVAHALQRFRCTARTLAYVGSGSLFILIFHYYVHNLAMGRLVRYGGNDYVSALAALFLSIVVPLCMLEVAKRISVLRYLFLPVRREKVSNVCS